MPNKTTQILKEAELKINSLFHELGLLEPYGKLDNPNYVTPYEKTIKIITEALAQQQQEDEKERDEYYAYCACDDTLERTGLYPKDATYYCFGCDKTYKLFQEDYQEVLDLELMKDEQTEFYNGPDSPPEVDYQADTRNDFRKELRKAIAEKRGKV